MFVAASEEVENLVMVEDNREYLRVLKIRPLFPLTYLPMPPMVDPRLLHPAMLSSITKPILEMILEDGSIFRMSSIPNYIALEIWDVLERKKRGLSLENPQDPRLTLAQLITEIADVRKVKIYDILPDLNVFVAEIEVLPEGFDRPVKFPMVPSHAILVALRAGADIYVAKDLVEELKKEEAEVEKGEGFYDV